MQPRLSRSAQLHVLIVEDNSDILANLYSYLEPLGYILDSARDGFAGLSMAADDHHDVIVLDLMLPGIDGLEVCRRVRHELRRATPILMLTARDTVDDRIRGLNSGADDYLVKPFSMGELDARLQALARRSQGHVASAALRVGDLRFDPSTYELTRAGRTIELSPMGYRLLHILMRESPAIVRRETLELELWGDERPLSDALRTHIHAVRQAIENDPTRSMLITVPTVGYRLIDPDAR